MSASRSVARSELRAYFLSPVALIFVATFLLASLFSFFWIEGFFTRNIADIRPLFRWFPVLLAFLVPALGMRLWAEETRTGTIELLGTLPLRPQELVIGKFLSALGLVAVALALTLPVPLTVGFLGDLDWGPVWGGYAATLLLAATYLSMTLLVSAQTASQLVALVVSALVCSLLYVVGSEGVVGFFGNRGGELLRAIGIGARFDAIQRGVLDLRDIAYFVSLTTFFLAANTLSVAARRWGGSERGARRRQDEKLGLALLGANVLALNVLVHPLHGARIDLTENNEFSISPVTRSLLEGLDEPLLIRGYFTERTHPLLAPLVPRIRDLVDEYGALGDGRVRAEFIDPTSDEALEKEAGQEYGIEPVPFSFADRHEQSVVNSYFHVLVRYGDQFEVLDFEDLIEVQANGMEIDVKLRNLEYDLTRAIQKVVYGFQSIESVFARLPSDAKLTAFVSEQGLPEPLKDAKATVQRVAEDLGKRSGGRFTFSFMDPDSPGAPMDRKGVYEAYGLQPLAASLLSQESFYLHLLLEVGEKRERLMPAGEFTEATVKDELIAALKRGGKGTLKTIGIAQGGGSPPPQQMPGMPPRGDGKLPYRTLREFLGQTYAVEDEDLGDGSVAGDVDVLIVLDPRGFGDVERFALDQFLMRGGSAIVAGGGFVLDASAMEGLAVEKSAPALADWLRGFGISVGDEIVLDKQNAAFPIPVTRNLGGFMVREIQMMAYPAFVDVRQDGMAKGHPALAGLPGVILQWAATVSATGAVDGVAPGDATKGLPERTELFRTTADAWLLDDYRAQPDFDTYPDAGWKEAPDHQRYPLAVAASGPFTSAWKGKTAPDLGADATAQGGVIESSPEGARLVVIGSASFVSDPMVEISRRVSDAWMGNIQLVQNLVDWTQEDTELLKIRARGNYARILKPTEPGTRRSIELGNYGFALVAVAGIAFLTLSRRRDAKPMELDARRDGEVA